MLLAEYLPSGRPVLLLATKMDKLAASAQRTAERGIAAAIAADFPAQAVNVAVVPFSATRRLGIAAAEATIAAWLGLDADADGAQPPAAADDTQKKGPRDQGE